VIPLPWLAPWLFDYLPFALLALGALLPRLDFGGPGEAAAAWLWALPLAGILVLLGAGAELFLALAAVAAFDALDAAGARR